MSVSFLCITCCNPNPEGDVMVWGLWGLTRSRRLSHHDGTDANMTEAQRTHSLQSIIPETDL